MRNVRGICCSKPGASNHEPWKHKRQNQLNNNNNNNNNKGSMGMGDVVPL